MSESYPPALPTTSRTRWALLAVWAGMSVAALAFVLHLGRNGPWADEWEAVPGLLGAEPFGNWLFRQHNEHRLPLPRLVWWILFQLTHDFRTGMVAQVALLSALSLGLMRLAANVRGRPHWADAFFPVSLLHWGHAENLLMGYQVCFVLTLCGVAGLIAVAVRTTADDRPMSGFYAAIILLLLELTGGSGMPFVPFVGVWVVVTSATSPRQSVTPLAALMALCAMAGVVSYLVIYLITYSRPPLHPPPNLSDPLRAGRVIMQYLAMAVGIGSAGVWLLAGGFVSGVAAVTARLQLHELYRKPSSPALLAVLLGSLGLAAAVGVGRSSFPNEDMGLWSRYSLLAWPVLGIGFFTFQKAGGKVARFGPTTLCLVAVVALPQNTLWGWRWGTDYAKQMDDMEAGVREGLSPKEVIRKVRYLREVQRDEQIEIGMPLLQDAGVGYFPLLKTAADP